MRTATNPETGEKVQYNETTGNWEPMQAAPQTALPDVGAFETGIEGAARGMTLGLSDKVVPASMGLASGITNSIMESIKQLLPEGTPVPTLPPPGDLFTQSMEDIKQRKAAQSEAYPVIKTGSEIAGSMLPGILVGKIPSVAKALVEKPVRTAGKLGAGFGAATTLGNAEDIEQLPGDLVENTLLSGAMGLGIGFGADRLAAPIARGVSNITAGPRAQAKTIISRYFRDIFPDEQAAQTAARSVGPEGTLMDVSRGTRQLGQTLAAKAPSFGQKAEEFLIHRSKGAAKRISETVRNALGTRGQSIKGTLETDVMQQAQRAGKLYDQAFTKSAPIESLNNFVQQIDDYAARFENTGASPVLNKLKRSLFKTMDGEKVFKESIEELHFARKDFADRIFKMRKDSPQMAGELKPLRDMFDELMPDEYIKANGIWSGKKSYEDAINLGRQVLKKDVDFFADEMARMSQADKNGVLLGASRAIDDMVKNVQEGAKVTRQLDKPLIAERLAPLFPDEASFNTFMDRVGIENTYNLTKNAILSGSQTHERQAAEALFARRTADMSPDKFAMMRRGLEWLRGVKGDKGLNISDQTVDELSDMLLQQGEISPDTIRNLMKTPLAEKIDDFIYTVTSPATAGIAETMAE